MRQISCTDCTTPMMRVSKEECPFVTPWKFKYFLCCCHYSEHLFWNSSLELT